MVTVCKLKSKRTTATGALFIWCLLVGLSDPVRGQEVEREKREMQQSRKAALKKSGRLKRDHSVALKILGADLKQVGIAMEKASLQTYLRRITGLDHDGIDDETWIRRLGAPKLAERRAAQQALEARMPVKRLREAIRDSDPERAERAQNILDNFSEHRQTARKALDAITYLNLSGLTEEIVSTAGKFQDDGPIERAARRALSVTPDDVPYLLSLITPETMARGSEFPIHALRRLETPVLADRFQAWSQHTALSEDARLESALALADLGDRRSLAALLNLMVESKSASVRARSQVALKKLTGLMLDYDAYAKASNRAIQAEAWRRWGTEKGQTATLTFPLRSVRWVSSSLEGHTLMTLYSQGVVEYDEKMNEVWRYACKAPRTAEKMENGNILITSRENDRIFEVTPEKKVVRELRVKKPTSARPLKNGNLLITSYKVSEVREIDREGRVVWTASHGQEEGQGYYYYDAIRLENGHTLTLEPYSDEVNLWAYLVAEYDLGGQRVWERIVRGNLGAHIQALDNGNVLVTRSRNAPFFGNRGDTADITEIDRATGEVVWELETGINRGALRLLSGNTLIRYYDRVVEVDPSGMEIWSKSGVSYGSMRR